MRIHRYLTWPWCLVTGILNGALAAPRSAQSNLPDVSYDASRSSEDIPDFGRYIHLKTLEWTYVQSGDSERRLIVVGDIHGMLDPLENLLKTIDYSPDRDTLIHTGDVTYRGPHSLEVLDFLAAHNVDGVRGNHDQRVVEWRAWIEWITGHEGGLEWLEKEERRAVEDGGEGDKLVHASRNKWKQIPEGWDLMGEHYQIARNMSAAAASYLYSLPLALHIPQLHTFIVHGGLLPSDPTKDVMAPSQPLARVPSHSPEAEKSDNDRWRIEKFKEHGSELIAALRRAQEGALLEEVKQNMDPWVILNMRGVTEENEVTRDGDDPDSTPWSDIWNSVVSLCHGFDVDDSTSSSTNLMSDGDAQRPFSKLSSPDTKSGPYSHLRLPCYPVTVVYGHAASRDLDLKRWSKGLDTGCSYERKLTALILTSNGHSFDLNSTRIDVQGVEAQKVRFGEKELGVDASVVSVPCGVSDPE